MNEHILHTEVQEYIHKHLNTDVASILFKGVPFDGVSAKEVVLQIESKKKCEKKLPTWSRTEGIYFPKKLSIEQTSSETTARYKAKLVSGKSLVDITGGLGVDTFFFSKNVEKVMHCEIDEELSKIAAHNYQALGANNIDTHAGDGIRYLEASTGPLDWIYADPSRRNDAKGKVFLLKDCLPDVVEHLDLFFERSKNILIKTAPLLDITQGLRDLKHVKEVHCVAVGNEMKELLWVLEHDYQEEPVIIAMNLQNEGEQRFEGSRTAEAEAIVQYSAPKKYLYEPNAAILKAGFFKSLCRAYEVTKLHQHSHLYTSDQLVDFPGKRFLIEDHMPFNKKKLKRKLKGLHSSIATRNFGVSAAQLKKELHIKESSTHQLFFTTDESAKGIVLLCHRIT